MQVCLVPKSDASTTVLLWSRSSPHSGWQHRMAFIAKSAMKPGLNWHYLPAFLFLGPNTGFLAAVSVPAHQTPDIKSSLSQWFLEGKKNPFMLKHFVGLGHLLKIGVSPLMLLTPPPHISLFFLLHLVLSSSSFSCPSLSGETQISCLQQSELVALFWRFPFHLNWVKWRG